MTHLQQIPTMNRGHLLIKGHKLFIPRVVVSLKEKEKFSTVNARLVFLFCFEVKRIKRQRDKL